MTTQPVLVVEHESQCPPGWFGDWLAEAGCPVDVRRPYAGDTLPATLDDHRSMLVLGGSMDATSDGKHPWLSDVKQLVRQAAAARVPVLGICLGHQLAAVALGGTVERNPRGQTIGVLEVGWADRAATDPLMGAVAGARIAVQWNNDIVTAAPAGMQALARTRSGDLQAARFAPTVWGVQSHPEAHAAIVKAWADNDRDAALERGVDVDEYVDQVAAATEELRASWEPLATRFASLTREHAATW